MARRKGGGLGIAVGLAAAASWACLALPGCRLATTGLGPDDPEAGSGTGRPQGMGAGDGGGPDEASTLDAGSGSDASDGASSDAGGLDAAHTPDSGPGGDGGPGTPDAAPCVTSFPGKVLFTFDGGDVTGWIGGVNADGAGSGLTATVSGSTAHGHTCPGALALTSSFSAYGNELTQAELTFQPASTWTQGKLHVWVAIAVPPSNAPGAMRALDAVQPYIQWNNFSDGNYSGWTTINPDLADGAWHEIVLDLTADGQGQIVEKLAIQIATQSAQFGSADSAPSPTILYVDDVWLE